MAKYSIILVMTALILPHIQALEFARQPEDEILDKWLQEQVAESQSSQGVPVRSIIICYTMYIYLFYTLRDCRPALRTLERQI